MATLVTHAAWAVTLPAELGGLGGCGRGPWGGYEVTVLTAPHTDVVGSIIMVHTGGVVYVGTTAQ